MARKKIKTSIDWAALQEQVRSQFVGLDPNDPSLWPMLPRGLLLAAAALAVIVVLWFVWLGDYESKLVAERTRENQLRTDYKNKLTKAVNLEALKQQLEQVQQYVTQLEKQLPSKAEMSALLSDINQAGLGRSLQFELFRPGALNVQEYYAEQPIAVRVTGSYHDMALFAADIASLSRIVTLNNLSIAPVATKPNTLALDATAKTFRYLDPEEVLARKNAKKEAEKKDGSKKGATKKGGKA